MEQLNGRPSVVLRGSAAVVVIDLSGGAIGDFHLATGDNPVNPLAWNLPKAGDAGIHGFGHFLCLDRWGPPSDAEGARGMPYHGEASNVAWTLERESKATDGHPEAVMTARLPKAGLGVRRQVQLAREGTVFRIRETVTNENALGRVYNMVQHPTIGGAFLEGTTIVDCNGRRGFAQGGSLPNPEEPSSYWPRALNPDGTSVDVRHLTDNPNPNVVSYAIDDTHGWITAATPERGLLIGYLWKTVDYPWVSLWRDVQNGRPSARGLEFGTTGLHQPFSILVKKGRIWDRPLFEYLDSGESATRSYTGFLLKVPPDFAGVASITVLADRLVVRERRADQPREWTLPAENLLP